MKKDSLYLTERQHQANRLLREGDYKSIREMLGRIKDQLPKQPILAELDDKKEIKYWNSEELYEEVMSLGDGLLDAGLGGKHIAIVSENCVRYVIADICISSGVGVVTPIDVNAPAPLLAMLLAKCDADAALCGAEQLPLLRELQPQCPRLKALITIDKKVDGVPYYEELVARGREIGEGGPYRTCELDLDAPAKILFTSGTTGANKGVVLTNANLSASISFNGKGTINGNDGSKSGEGSGSSDASAYRRIYYHPVTGEYIPGGFLYYMNPNAPWSVSFSYNFSYRKQYQYKNNQLIDNKSFTQTVNASGNLKLTPRLNVRANANFDLMAMRITTTQITATYDLHCFNIDVSWIPTGMWKSYSFRIAANASALADLLRFKKSSSYMDNMLSSGR